MIKTSASLSIIMKEPIMVTTGVYDFIKDQLHRKRVTPLEEELLKGELKSAVQLTSRELPSKVVKVGSLVLLKDHTIGIEKEFQVVGSGKSNPSKGKFAINSSIVMAILGRNEGSVLDWPFKEGIRRLEILRVVNPN